MLDLNPDTLAPACTGLKHLLLTVRNAQRWSDTTGMVTNTPSLEEEPEPRMNKSRLGTS